MKNKKLNEKVEEDKEFKDEHLDEGMTLIIGAKCKDGVVLIADKKVVEGNIITSQEKIGIPPLGIVVGGAGTREIIDKFNERVPDILEERKLQSYEEQKKVNSQIKLEEVNPYKRAYMFLEDCENLLLQLKNKHIFSEQQHLHSSILVAVLVDRKVELHYLDTVNCLDSKRTTYKCIGSGRPYAEFLLKKLWDKNLTMKEMAKIGKFIINLISEMEVDNNVGHGTQIIFSPNIPSKEEVTSETIDKYRPKKEILTGFEDKELREKYDKVLDEIQKEIKD